MRLSSATVLLMAALALAACPLGYTPETACSASSPGCGLFSDADGDGLCDNPGPQPAVEDPVQQDTTSTQPDGDDPSTPDTSSTGTDPGVTEPDSSSAVEIIQAEEPQLPGDTLPSDSLEPDGPGSDSVCVIVSCPLGYTPEQACPSESPSCALFRDGSGDGFCDNPGPRDSIPESIPPDSTVSAVIESSTGCPRGLPPAAACPYERQLCPHWFGRWTDDACANPSAGRRRAAFVLGSMSILLGIATVLSRRLRGGRRIRRKARASRLAVLGAGLLALGFGVQGCFCPLGTFQYALGGSALSFLGLAGILVLALPVVHALFFGRVYCGWVCPMGALQEILWKIDILRLPQPGRKLDRLLIGARTVLFVMFTAAVALAWRGTLRVPWPALFCSVDPFHAVFSLFLAGSMVLGLVMIVLSILWGRFFCRYLCFYGFILGLACRAGLWTRICRLTRRGAGSCEPDSEESSGSCEIGTK